MKNQLAILFAALLLSACAVTPPAIVQRPTSLPAQTAKPHLEVNGSIFQAATYRPLYEDKKARMLGDVLTITISENTTAGKTSASTASRSGSVNFTAPSIFGVPSTTTAQAALATSGANKFADAGTQNSSNTFNGTISVTVIDVLPNGNLLVSGEKQLAFDKGMEFVRFSGVVNPTTISVSNVVPSTQVADAKFEYRSTTHVDKAEMNSMLSRFFLSLLPL